MMSRRLALFSFGLFFTIQFLIFSYLVHKDIFTQLDFNATVLLQDNISRRLDDLFSTFSDIGKFEIMTILLIAVFLIAKKFWAGLLGIGLYIGFHLIEIFGKVFVNHPPPPEFMLRTKKLIDFPQFHIRTENSYPSGHSGRTLFLITIFLILIWSSKRLSLQVKCILSGLIFLFTGTMLISRVYLGEHWMSDVIGGSFLGLALGFFGGIFAVKNKKL